MSVRASGRGAPGGLLGKGSDMRTQRVAVVALGVSVVCCASTAGQGAPARLHRLFQERHAWQKHESPRFAMSRGDYSSANRIADGSLAAIERRHGETQAFLKRLREIDRAQLNETDRLSYDLFELSVGQVVEGHRFRTFLAPIGARFGPQQRIPQMHERVRFASAEDYANYLERLEQVPRATGDVIELLKLGVEEGRTPPRVTLLGVPGQFEALEEGGLESLGKPFEKMPRSISWEQRDELRERFNRASFPAVREAMRTLGRFVAEEYIPKCTESVAAVNWPDGEAYYAFQLRTMTTTEMTARQIHETGLREVARLKIEMMEVIRSSDFLEKSPSAAELKGQELFQAFVKYLRSDPRFYHTSEAALLTGYRDICKRVDAWLPKLFKTLPRLPYGVREIPAFMAPSQTTAYYSRGDIDNAEPGYFYANTYALDQRPKYEMISLAMHEAVPGHHLQIAIAQELDGLPEFRKNSYFTAFGEGWALYSERLGIEMGLYEDPYDNFGRLLYEMWRACRLVVDPGMHALGWSREQAIQFMLDNTALSELNITTEVDRYIAWPGQATGYKIGELKIRELRQRAERKLSSRFDIRAFHDTVLGAGPLPLTMLERRINDWIDAVVEKDAEGS